MRRALPWILPLVVAALVALAQHATYPAFLAHATEITRDLVPMDTPPSIVQVSGDRLRVLGAAQPSFVHVPAIGWNLPVLVCLWGWIVGGRRLALLAAALLLVIAHVVVADLAIRRGLGELVGWPHAIYRAWYIWIAPLLPIVCVALGRFAGTTPQEQAP